ncbi:MAG: glycoside hydrolase family 130 protein [Jatrophihabitantaceae bacterium]
MTEALAHRTSAELRADSSRVVARLFLPGEQPHEAHSRAGAIADRVLALDETKVEQLATCLLEDYASRHLDYPQLLRRHAAIVAAHVDDPTRLSSARTLVLGASFTAEYATEAAALCNPSAVVHPDQSGVQPGQLRVAVSLRAIGEGHLSSISFGTALIGPGPLWMFTDRERPVVAGVAEPTRWSNDQLRAVLTDLTALTDQGSIDELSTALLHALPVHFEASDVERALAETPVDLLIRPSTPASMDLLRRVVSSAYQVEFPESTTLTQRILLPSAAEESGGMEDARFTRFTGPDGAVEYRATYTAYDGRQIAPRLLISPDLRRFRAHRLAGPAARNKGMALFPRLVNGQHLALCRTDGENISLATSADGYTWSPPQLLHQPARAWEMLQVGNCGPPIETDRGWLVLTHGVGPMRTYSIGALLLQLDQPSHVIGRLSRPLLEPNPDERDGYVPNVVYSCGGLLHDGRLWLPYGIDDSRIGVAWAPLEELLSELAATP